MLFSDVLKKRSREYRLPAADCKSQLLDFAAALLDLQVVYTENR